MTALALDLAVAALEGMGTGVSSVLEAKSLGHGMTATATRVTDQGSAVYELDKSSQGNALHNIDRDLKNRGIVNQSSSYNPSATAQRMLTGATAQGKYAALKDERLSKLRTTITPAASKNYRGVLGYLEAVQDSALKYERQQIAQAPTTIAAPIGAAVVTSIAQKIPAANNEVFANSYAGGNAAPAVPNELVKHLALEQKPQKANYKLALASVIPEEPQPTKKLETAKPLAQQPQRAANNAYFAKRPKTRQWAMDMMPAPTLPYSIRC